jgi:hypothetical protein
VQGAEDEGVVEVEACAIRVHACSELFRSQGIVGIVEDLIDVVKARVPFHLIRFRLRHMGNSTQTVDSTVVSRCRKDLALSGAVGVTDHWGTREGAIVPKDLGEFGTVSSSVGVTSGTETVVTVVGPVGIDPVITLKAGNQSVTNLRPEQDIFGLCATIEAFNASVNIRLDDDIEPRALDKEPDQAPDFGLCAAREFGLVLSRNE